MIKLLKPFLIAEGGINHNGSLNIAKRLIDLASKVGFDAIKFQKRDLSICIPEKQGKILRETPWGMMTYLEYKKKIEFSENQIKSLIKHAKKNKIDLFFSCWDINSLKKLNKFKFRYNKVPSALITHTEFLDCVAREKKLTFISTGMCNISDINKAVKIFKKRKCKFVLMHCVSVYPCQEKDLNLNLIAFYKKKYKCHIGYSGHESTVSPSITAYMMGANYIERHITLDRSMWGTDQSASLSRDGMMQLRETVDKINLTLGNGKKGFSKGEKLVSKKMRYWL